MGSRRVCLGDLGLSNHLDWIDDVERRGEELVDNEFYLFVLRVSLLAAIHRRITRPLQRYALLLRRCFDLPLNLLCVRSDEAYYIKNLIPLIM